MLGKHLNWNSHIDKIYDKLSRTVGIINKLKHVLPQYVLLTLYNEFVLHHIYYCLVAWSDHHTKQLENYKHEQFKQTVHTQGTLKTVDKP